MLRVTPLLSLVLCVAGAPVPPCTTPLNPALETICYTTVSSTGNFSVRDLASGLNVSLITATASVYGGNWALQSQEATTYLLEYFQGFNAVETKVPLTVPMFYRPQGPNLLASMAIPTSAYPNPAFAPKPSYFSVEEPFPAMRIAALSFETPALAIDLEYSFACGELAEILTLQGITPVAGPWAQAWVTYSGRAASPHVNECWARIPSPA